MPLLKNGIATVTKVNKTIVLSQKPNYLYSYKDDYKKAQYDHYFILIHYNTIL